MNRLVRPLLALLVVQIVLTVVAFRSGDHLSPFRAEQRLLEVDFEKLSRIAIEEQDKEPLVLAKHDGKWTLPSLFDFPVSSDKLSLISDTLLGTRRSWPVGKTQSAARQFRVSETSFERKLSFFEGEKKVCAIFLGSAPVFRKIHARVESEDFTYVISFNTFDVSLNALEWIDREVLAFDTNAVERLEHPAFTLNGQGGRLSLTDLSADEETNEDEVSALVHKLSGLQFDTVLGTEAKPEYNLQTPVLSLVLKLSGREPRSYSFSGPFEENFYALKVSDLPWLFKVTKASAGPLKAAKREELSKKKEQKPAENAVDAFSEESAG